MGGTGTRKNKALAFGGKSRKRFFSGRRRRRGAEFATAGSSADGCERMGRNDVGWENAEDSVAFRESGGDNILSRESVGDNDLGWESVEGNVVVQESGGDIVPGRESAEAEGQVLDRERVYGERAGDNVSDIGNTSRAVGRESAENYWGMKIVPERADNKFVFDGRRIVDINFFFHGLQNFQHFGNYACTLANVEIVSETRRGLISTINFKCNMCNEPFSVDTSEHQKKMTVSDVNYATVLWGTSTGGGLSQLQELTSLLKVPCMSSKTYQKIGKQVRNDWLLTAKSCMEDAAEEEKKAAIERGDIDSDGIPYITVITDGCWSKRSYRGNFSALSGAAAIVGFHTKKILYLGVKNKFCLICERAKRANVEPRVHECSANYKGPSTGMEADIICEGFMKSEELYGLRYRRFIADGDCSVYHKIMIARPYGIRPVKKIECRNHLFRNFERKLRDLDTNTTFSRPLRTFVKSKYRGIVIAVKKAIQHWSAVEQNQISLREKISKLSQDIKNSPYHVFGQHEKCASYFCSKPENLAEKIIEMQTDGIFWDILKISNHFSTFADSLIYGFNSNIAEQYNSIVAKFVGGKRINFIMSDSYSTRCHAALVQHNTGSCYSSLSKVAFRENADGRVQKLHLRRNLKNAINNERRKITVRKRTAKTTFDGNYGTDTCAKPDKSIGEQETDKIAILNLLREKQRDRTRIEEITREQSLSQEWLQIRRNLITASVFGIICKRRVKTFAPVVKQILYTDLSRIRAIKYGRYNELRAIEQLGIQINETIEKCGLFIDEDMEFLGATPDGVIGDRGLVEIKCPFKFAGKDIEKEINAGNYKFWKKEKKTGKIVINERHNYYYQVQGQLNITRRDFCYFAVWTSENRPLKVAKIYRDELFWKNICDKLRAFYFKSYLPELIDPRHPRSLPIREPSSDDSPAESSSVDA